MCYFMQMQQRRAVNVTQLNYLLGAHQMNQVEAQQTNQVEAQQTNKVELTWNHHCII